MKILLRVSVIAGLVAASIAFAGEWPPTSPVGGTEGPDMRATQRAPSTQSVPRADGARSR